MNQYRTLGFFPSVLQSPHPSPCDPNLLPYEGLAVVHELHRTIKILLYVDVRTILNVCLCGLLFLIYEFARAAAYSTYSLSCTWVLQVYHLCPRRLDALPQYEVGTEEFMCVYVSQFTSYFLQH